MPFPQRLLLWLVVVDSHLIIQNIYWFTTQWIETWGDLGTWSGLRGTQWVWGWLFLKSCCVSGHYSQGQLLLGQGHQSWFQNLHWDLDPSWGTGQGRLWCSQFEKLTPQISHIKVVLADYRLGIPSFSSLFVLLRPDVFGSILLTIPNPIHMRVRCRLTTAVIPRHVTFLGWFSLKPRTNMPIKQALQ